MRSPRRDTSSAGSKRRSCQVALDLPGGAHEWATGVRLLDHDGQLRLVWHGGHEHVCKLTGPPVVQGDRLLVPTAEHGQLVLRALDPTDTWRVFPANCTAWEARHGA